MPVKQSQSGLRMLSALEAIARNQPVGVTDLARLIGDNVAATQRAIATLAGDDWIRQAPGKPTRWELTARIHMIAQSASGSHGLRQRARSALERLWAATNESILLIVPEDGRFVVIDVLESPQYVRTAAPIGLVVPVSWGSASARAILPWMTPDEQARYLGERPSDDMQGEFAASLRRGYAVSEGTVLQGSTNIAAAILELDGHPAGAVLLSAPTGRMGKVEVARLGAMVRATAVSLSRYPRDQRQVA